MRMIILALLQTTTPTLAPSPAGNAAVAPASTVTLARDTPVELMAPTEVSTASAKPGTRFRLRVNKPVIVDGRTIIPVGTPAYGEVVTAIGSGGLGVSGKMTARLLAIRLGEMDIPLEGELSAKGTGAGSAGMAVLFTGVVGLFHRGNNAKIKAGELISGFVARDVTLDVSGPVPRVPVAITPQTPAPATLR